MSVVLYKAGNSETWCGVSFTSKVFSDDDAKAALKNGEWVDSPFGVIPPDATSTAVSKDDDAPLSRAELLEMAKTAGLKVDGRWSDERLLSEVKKAML